MTGKEKIAKLLQKAFKDCCQHLKCKECIYFAYGGDVCLFYKYADALLALRQEEKEAGKLKDVKKCESK